MTLTTHDWSVCTLKPVFTPHAVYQAFALQHQQSAYGSGVVLISKDWHLAVKLWMTDFSSITTLLMDEYSARGPEARDPASLFRSYLLLLMTNPTMGITEWMNEMKRTPIYAILSGFDLDDLPGVGTFYDFFERLWPSVDKHLKSRFQPKRKKENQDRQEGGESPNDHTWPSTATRSVDAPPRGLPESLAF